MTHQCTFTVRNPRLVAASLAIDGYALITNAKVWVPYVRNTWPIVRRYHLEYLPTLPKFTPWQSRIRDIKHIQARLTFQGIHHACLSNAQATAADHNWRATDVMQSVRVWLPKAKATPVVWLRAEDCGANLAHCGKAWRD